MGSLYDIGNFRYKHFTFYSCNSENSCNESPPVTYDDNGIKKDEIVEFLDRVWPYKGLFIGDSSEGDYSFVTYVTQTGTSIEVKNIYIYKRVRIADENTNNTLVWKRVIDPVSSLKPGVV